jgi:two-component system sensor histidine kinase UhpB
VYRVAQEALSNVVRHARAHTTALVLQRLATGDVRLEVRDDGVGFDPSAARSGFGLLGATERAAALGGALSVSSRPGAGTVLTLNLPGSATAE